MNAEYFKLYNEYIIKYGKNTAILMEIGSFYELLDEINIETGESKANVREVADILGLQLSIKRHNTIDEIMCGIPEHTLHRWASKLTILGWTVIIVTQNKNTNGKIISRTVSRILSPSTHIESISACDIPYIFTIVFTSATHGPPTFGVAALDLTTGTTHTYVGSATGHKHAWSVDDLAQMMTTFQAKEIIFYSTCELHLEEDNMRRLLCIHISIPIHFRIMETKGAFINEMVCTEYLQRIYNIKSILPPRTYLGIRTHDEEYALLMLLQFAEDHFPTMLKTLRRNEAWQPDKHLICGGHALTQLQITGTNSSECVLGLFNKAISPMGKRAMKERIMRPYSDTEKIRYRLSEVSNYLLWSSDKSIILERELRFMYDLPRLHRKVVCGMIQQTEIGQLFQTYRAIDTIQKQVTNDTLLIPIFTYETWSDYIAHFHQHFTENKMPSLDQTVFSVETYPEIGKKEQEIVSIIENINGLRQHIATIASIPIESIRLEEREREPFGFKCSSIVLQQLKKHQHQLPEGTKFSELKSGGWMDNNTLQHLNNKLQRARDVLQQLIHLYLPDACISITEAGNRIWQNMEEWISHLDTTQCIGRVSKERGYTCPSIQSNVEQCSSFEINKMRHPLIESLSTRVSYVPHDVSLNDITPGMMVYGVNSSGKTVCMKSVGICIILAQAGCFIPAHSMSLVPFKSIYTRILNNDNIFSGLSSFGVEMAELREILRHSNSNTVVLADELCSGTESTSALSIVASTIKWLTKQKSKFIFTTHLHGLPSLIEHEKEKVLIKHLHVEYDPATKKLIYDRSLRDGSGSMLYGLEVARAMDLPFEFIDYAVEIRHQIVGSTNQQHAKSSSWNSTIVRRVCEMCQMPIVKELEVHHIKERKNATDNILPDGTHMNHAQNLIVICQICHDKIHAGNVTIGPLQHTSDGPERIVKYSDTMSTNEHTPSIKKGKWSEEEMKTVKETLQKYSSLSLKAIRAHLSSKYSIEISEAVLARVKRE